MVRILFSALVALAFTASTAMSIELRPVGGGSSTGTKTPTTVPGGKTATKLPSLSPVAAVN